jgi:hypothetical protein
MIDYPDTLSYMIAGYIVIFSGILIYLISLYFRFRRAHSEKARLTNLIYKRSDRTKTKRPLL